MTSKDAAIGDTVAQSHIQPKLSGLERIFLILLIPIILSKLLYHVLLDCCFDPAALKSSRSLKLLVFKNLGVTVSPILSLRQVRSFQRPTGEVVQTFCRERHFTYDSVRVTPIVPAGGNEDAFPPATLHIIRCSSTPLADSTKSALRRQNVQKQTPLLLYFHGGGYVVALNSAGLEMPFLLATAASADLAILEYTLSPSLKYPGHLAQAGSAINYLLQTRRPAELILGGDSAGGNLLLGILAHLKKPHPDPRVARIDLPVNPATGGREGFKAAICLSPRCSNLTTSASFARNKRKDTISPRAVDMILQNWCPIIDHVWASANREPYPGFWREDTPVEKVLLIAGEYEVYVDDIIELAKMMDWTHPGESQRVEETRGQTNQVNTHPKVDLKICKNAIHDQGIVDLSLGIRDGAYLAQTLAWIKENL